MALNASSNSITSLLSGYHPSHGSNAYDASTVSAQSSVHYNHPTATPIKCYDNYATKIPKSGTTFLPETVAQVAELEIQVVRGTIIKT